MTNPVVKPVSITVVDWEALESLIGKSIRGIDRESPLALPLALSRHVGVEDIHSSPILRLISLTFLVTCSQAVISESMTRTPLNHLNLDFPNSTLIHGSLNDWVFSILLCCSGKESVDLRKLYNRFFLLFNATDVKKLWSNYTKVDNNDDTIILKAKR